MYPSTMSALHSLFSMYKYEAFDKYLITSHHLRVYKSSKVLRVNRLNNARSTRKTYPLNNVNIAQPRPQGFSLKKWVGRDFCIIYSYKNFLHINLDFLNNSDL